MTAGRTSAVSFERPASATAGATASHGPRCASSSAAMLQKRAMRSWAPEIHDSRAPCGGTDQAAAATWPRAGRSRRGRRPTDETSRHRAPDDRWNPPASKPIGGQHQNTARATKAGSSRRCVLSYERSPSGCAAQRRAGEVSPMKPRNSRARGRDRGRARRGRPREPGAHRTARSPEIKTPERRSMVTTCPPRHTGTPKRAALG